MKHVIVYVLHMLFQCHALICFDHTHILSLLPFASKCYYFFRCTQCLCLLGNTLKIHCIYWSVSHLVESTSLCMVAHQGKVSCFTWLWFEYNMLILEPSFNGHLYNQFYACFKEAPSVQWCSQLHWHPGAGHKFCTPFPIFIFIFSHTDFSSLKSLEIFQVWAPMTWHHPFPALLS